MTETHKNKIVIIGAGNVGATIAYTLMIRKQANDIVLVDLNEGLARGTALDIGHGTGFFKQVRVRQGGYDECADAQVIIITAGLARKPGQTRLDLAKANVSIIQSVTRSIMQYAKNPLIVVVSNPADILTAAVTKESGLPAGRVIGSGTSLDTARFRYSLSRMCDVNIADIDAFILGEHGDSQVPIWSQVSIGGLSLDEFCKQKNIVLDKETLAEWTKDAGAEVIGLKGATFYGIAMSVSSIIETIMKDEHGILPVAHVLDESFGDWAGVAISLPCLLGWDGIEQSFCIPMNDEERAAMDASVKTLKDFQKQALGI